MRHPWENPEVLRFAEEALRQKTDILKLSEKLSKGPFAEMRSEILDYIALVPKFRKKFRTEAFLACDRLALEQSTAADIGIYKARLFPEGESIDDLCCGMGGDSFFLSKNSTVRGYDLSPDRTAMYRFNTKAMGHEREAVLSDVRTVSSRGSLFTVDPARREKVGDNQRNFSELTPTLEEILEISRLYRGGMAKLPPGFPTGNFPADAEILYIGSRNDCRECLLLFGALASHKGKARAVTVDLPGNAHEWISRRNFSEFSEASELPVGTLMEFISEPLPVLVRSHLFSEVALESAPEASLVSPKIAYVTSKSPLESTAFRSYRVLGHVPLSTGKVKGLLRAFDIGKLTIKKRGVEIVPEAEIRRLSPKGHREGILFYTRLQGEKAAILAVPVRGETSKPQDLW